MTPSLYHSEQTWTHTEAGTNLVRGMCAPAPAHVNLCRVQGFTRALTGARNALTGRLGQFNSHPRGGSLTSLRRREVERLSLRSLTFHSGPLARWQAGRFALSAVKPVCLKFHGLDQPRRQASADLTPVALTHAVAPFANQRSERGRACRSRKPMIPLRFAR